MCMNIINKMKSLLEKPTPKNVTITGDNFKKAAKLEGFLVHKNVVGDNKFGTRKYFDDLTTVLSPETSKLFSIPAKNMEGDIEGIKFGTNNEKKLDYMKAVFEGLNQIPDSEDRDEKYLDAVATAFSGIVDYKEYMHDLQRACEYLMRDGAKNQGGKAFTRFIKSIQHVFTAIEELIKLNTSWDKQFKSAMKSKLEAEYNTKTAAIKNRYNEQITTICDKFKKGVDELDGSGSKYGFAVATAGVSIGGGVGVVATNSSASFFVNAVATLKSAVLGLAAKLGIALAPVVALVITSPITAGALGLGGIGAVGVKGVQYLRDNAAQKRLKADNAKREVKPNSVIDLNSLVS